MMIIPPVKTDYYTPVIADPVDVAPIQREATNLVPEIIMSDNLLKVLVILNTIMWVLHFMGELH